MIESYLKGASTNHVNLGARRWDDDQISWVVAISFTSNLMAKIASLAFKGSKNRSKAIM